MCVSNCLCFLFLFYFFKWYILYFLCIFFSLSLCTYIIYIIDLDLYYQTWAVCISHLSCFEMNKCERTYISTGADTQNTREKPTGCMQWPLSVCMWADEGMPTPLWKWTLCREHASHYHLGVTTSVSSVFMRPGQKSNSCFLLLKPKCCSSFSRVFSPRVQSRKQSFPPKKSSQC